MLEEGEQHVHHTCSAPQSLCSSLILRHTKHACDLSQEVRREKELSGGYTFQEGDKQIYLVLRRAVPT